MSTIEQPGRPRLLGYVGIARRRSRPAVRVCSRVRWFLPVAGFALLSSVFAPAARADVTIFVVSDTHYGFQVPDSSQQNQIRALNTLPGTAYPSVIGGIVAEPDAVFVLGDLIQEDELPHQFFRDYAGNGCFGGVRWPVYECSGNHDWLRVRDIIRVRHGELLYGVTIGGIRFQSLDDMPTVASVAEVDAKLAALPAGTPIIVFHHRALSNPGGYIIEWNPAAVNAYRNMLAGRNILAILFGHDHYSRHFLWEGYNTYSPGAVRHSPGTKFPESFLVIRITSTKLSVASWVFGNDVQNNTHYWVGGAWSWTHQKNITLNTAATPPVDVDRPAGVEGGR